MKQQWPLSEQNTSTSGGLLHRGVKEESSVAALGSHALPADIYGSNPAPQLGAMAPPPPPPPLQAPPPPPQEPRAEYSKPTKVELPAIRSYQGHEVWLRTGPLQRSRSQQFDDLPPQGSTLQSSLEVIPRTVKELNIALQQVALEASLSSVTPNSPKNIARYALALESIARDSIRVLENNVYGDPGLSCLENYSYRINSSWCGMPVRNLRSDMLKIL